jgi:N-dimethylarginine dimethylaminohydrolase
VDTGDVPAPHAHIDMAVHLLDDRTALVGDPRAALALWPRLVGTTGGRDALAAYASPTREEQKTAVASYEAVVRSLQGHGLEVRRIPAVHADGGDLVLSWTNAVADVVAGVRRAYVPAYGLRQLDAAAHAVWRRLGYHVVPIDAGSAALEGGAIRCLTNVFRTPAPRWDDSAAAGGKAAAGASR